MKTECLHFLILTLIMCIMSKNPANKNLVVFEQICRSILVLTWTYYKKQTLSILHFKNEWLKITLYNLTFLQMNNPTMKMNINEANETWNNYQVPLLVLLRRFFWAYTCLQ